MTATDGAAAAEALVGGLANAGAVFRRGDVVERPAPRNAPALHAFLRALRAQGFDAAPAPLGLTGDGREQLTFIPGEVAALPPFPDWAVSAEALRSVGGLLRRLHEASASIPVEPGVDWPRDMADPEGGTLLCHNDVCPDNVVFRDGRVVALIDFDFTAPGRPLWDLAMAARHWVPMLDPVSSAALYPAGLDVPSGLRLLADSYGLPPADRAQLPTVIEQATATCRAFMATRVAAAEPAFVHAFTTRGGWPRWDRIQSWLTAERDTFTAALLSD